jgi:hypothetical protein
LKIRTANRTCTKVLKPVRSTKYERFRLDFLVVGDNMRVISSVAASSRPKNEGRKYNLSDSLEALGIETPPA